MRRDHYHLFSECQIGALTLPNRLVRSATWDPSILDERRMTDAVLEVYRQVAAGGVGLIITGDFSVVAPGVVEEEQPCAYEDVRIAGYDRLVEAVHQAAPGCRIVAQVSGDYPGIGPSDIPSPYTTERTRVLTTAQIRAIVGCFARAIAGVQADGFDGVQLHAAHGGLLSRFLSPYANLRQDEYGDGVRIVREIVTEARALAGDFPILIKMNATDYMPGGVDMDNFPALARAVAAAGVDAIEVSGGMWDCLARPESELGFRPVPAPESHTRIKDPGQQSYFLPYVERVDVDVPIILVGGNRDVERLEAIVQQGHADLIALCRPLISEPDLPRRWQEGRGATGTDCISCNSCLYDMYTRLEAGSPGLATCVYKQDRARFQEAQRWLASWVKENVIV